MYFFSASGKQLVIAFAVLAVKAPDKAEKFCIKAFGTAVSHVGTGDATVFADAGEHTSDADTARVVKIKHRVAGIKTHGQRAVEIAVDDPTVGDEDFGELGVKYFFFAFHPAGIPPKTVEMIKRKPCLFGKRTGEGALTRAGRADDDDFFHKISFSENNFMYFSPRGEKLAKEPPRRSLGLCLCY